MRAAGIVAAAALAGLLAGPSLGADKTEAELLAAMEKDVAKIADKLSHAEDQADTSRIRGSRRVSSSRSTLRSAT